MNRLTLIRRCLIPKQRYLSSNPPTPTAAPTPNPDDSDHGRAMSARYRPSDFEKTILVWTKKFKSKDEVPKYVSAELIERSRSQARIKISNILIFLTCVGSFVAILAGKAAAKRGESVHQMNLDWHKQYDDEQKSKEASAAK